VTQKTNEDNNLLKGEKSALCKALIYARIMTKTDYKMGKISDYLSMIGKQTTCMKNLQNEKLGLLSKA
jgi:hypothetical protein